jgi:hypothetical protein
MHTHPNARLTPLGRERLLRRHIDHGEHLAFLAAHVRDQCPDCLQVAGSIAQFAFILPPETAQIHCGATGLVLFRRPYVEGLPDEKQATTVGFLLRAVAWFDGQVISCKRVLSDNGSAYRSKPWREACSALGLTPKRTRPYTPRTNGEAERFIKTLLAECAYSLAFHTSTERSRWLPRYLAIYNGRRCHMALAGRTPIQQLGLLRAT